MSSEDEEHDKEKEAAYSLRRGLLNLPCTRRQRLQ